MYYAYGCKTPPWNCQKIIKTRKEGGVKKALKKAERKEEETEKAGKNMVT